MKKESKEKLKKHIDGLIDKSEVYSISVLIDSTKDKVKPLKGTYFGFIDTKEDAFEIADYLSKVLGHSSFEELSSKYLYLLYRDRQITDLVFNLSGLVHLLNDIRGNED